MLQPYLKAVSQERNVVDAFYGLNRTLRPSEREMHDEKNISSDQFPVLSVRKRRGTYGYGVSGSITEPSAVRCIISKDNLCWVQGTTVYINGAPVSGLTLPASGEITPVSMGAYIVFLVKGADVQSLWYLNTQNPSEYGNCDNTQTTAETATVTFSLSDRLGKVYEDILVGDTAPAEPVNLQYWLDTGSSPHALRQWSETNGMWSTIGTTYVRISGSGINTGFSQFDGITISGLSGVLTDAGSGETYTDEQLAKLDAANIIQSCGTDWITVTGIIDRTHSIRGAVTVTRKAPLMDYICESENRLWGCRYGLNNAGAAVNEIYCCKLGDFKNWNCFMGLSTDSYAASCGTDGVWTGAITHLGYPIFFKENYLHKVYGSFPSEYQIQVTSCRGVQRDCSRSLAIVREALYYKSRSGIMLYDGSLPTEAGEALGEELYFNAVGGAYKNKYYVSMCDEAGAYSTFVLDTVKRIWHREDGEQPTMWCWSRDELYYIRAADGKIRTVNGTGAQDGEPVPWEMESGVIGCESPDHKYLGRMDIRMRPEDGERVWIEIEYDSDGVWRESGSVVGRGLRSFTLPIRPRRCDHFRIRLRGEGDCLIYSIAKIMEQGSDLQ